MRTPYELHQRALLFRSRVLKFINQLNLDTLSDEFAYGWLSRNFFDETVFEDLISDETFGKNVSTQEPILLVTPGTGRTTGIVALFWAYIVATEPVYVGVSQEDTYLARFIEGYFNDDEIRRTPTLSSLNDDQFEELLREFGTVIVYGSDSTIARFRKHSLPETRFVGYGSKFSIGLHLGSITQFDILQYFNDLVLYDGLGCLNTSVLYVENLGDSNTYQLEKLARELDNHYKDDDTATHFLRQFVEGVFLSGTNLVGNRIGARPVGDGSELALPVGYGTLYVVDLEGELEKIRQDLRGYRQFLSSATLMSSGLNPFPSSAIELLTSIGVQRVVRPGQAQNPKLSWSHDGMGNLAPLTTFIDLE